jgi:CheY-like chemotaxis protein
MGTMFFVELPLYSFDSSETGQHLHLLCNNKESNRPFVARSNKVAVEPVEIDFGTFNNIENFATSQLFRNKYDDNTLLQVEDGIEDILLPTNRSRNKWDRGLKILIVDDSLIGRKMLYNLLNSFGHSVDQAVDGVDFLVKLNIVHDLESDLFTVHNPFPHYDVVLIDESMPNMSGPDATKIARDNGYVGLIYGVTGNIDERDTKSFLSHGVDQVFHKPLNLDKLRACIDEDLAK